MGPLNPGSAAESPSHRRVFVCHPAKVSEEAGCAKTILSTLARRAYRVKSAAVCCSSSSTVPTVDIKKDTGTTAPGSGSTLLTGVITFSGTANTVVTGTLISTVATLTLAAGDRLTVSFAGTVGSIVNATVSVLLVPC